MLVGLHITLGSRVSSGWNYAWSLELVVYMDVSYAVLRLCQYDHSQKWLCAAESCS
jgi:hypothetical protein